MSATYQPPTTDDLAEWFRELRATAEIEVPRRAEHRVRILAKLLMITSILMSPLAAVATFGHDDDMIYWFGYPWLGFAVIGVRLNRYRNAGRGYTHSNQTFMVGAGCALIVSSTAWVPSGAGLASVVQAAAGGVLISAMWACRWHESGHAAGVASVRPSERVVEVEKIVERVIDRPVDRVVEVKVEHPGPVPADHARWAHLPATAGSIGYLYVIEFTTPVVKVGKTNDPARRLREHRRDAERFGLAVESVWISAAHDGYERNEAGLIAAARRKWRRSRQEYFHGADWVELAGFAEILAGGTAFET